MEANTKAIATVFNRLSAQLVNIAETWEATDNINDLDQNITAFTDMAAFEVEKEVGELEYNAYIELMGELGRYAGGWVNLYLNRASWSNRPEWLANSVRNAMNNGANTGINSSNVTEFSELSHAGQCLDIYLHNTASIYNAYTVPAIKRVVKAQRSGEYASTNPERFAKDVQEVPAAIQEATRLVRKYDGMQPTAQDIEAVTANYVAYIIETAQYKLPYELQNA